MGARRGPNPPVMDGFSSMNCGSQTGREIAGESRVGIFWVCEGRLLIDATPVSRASSYGDFRIHEWGHDAFWATLQRNRSVPKHLEYDEVPRGRVGYNFKEQTFYVFADTCILKDGRMMDRIKSYLSLPANAVAGRDSHYKCPGCTNRAKDQLEEKEEDWNS